MTGAALQTRLRDDAGAEAVHPVDKPTPAAEVRATGISGVLRRLASAGESERVSFGDLVDSFEIGAYAPLIVLFAAPNILPVALPGISALLGAPLILLTAQLMLGRRKPWLPGLLRRRSMRRSDLLRLVERIAPRLERLENRMRPRHPSLTGMVSQRLIGALGVVLSMIIFLPIPFGNALPGFALVLLALGLLARDGVMVVAGGAAAAAGLVVASGFVWGAVNAGIALVQHGLGL